MLDSRDIDKLRPDVAANVHKLLDICKAQGLKVLVTSTVRDAEYQAYLYAQGRTRPGNIVTNGKQPTFHWDKAGLAFDVCQNIRGHEYDDPGFFINVATLAKSMGFSWGGDWKSFKDKPHFQWDNHGKYTNSMILAGKMPPTMPLYKTKEDDEVETYRTINDVPAAYRPTIQKLVDKGLLKGTGGGNLDIDRTYCRVMVTLDRAGMLDK